MCIDITKWLAVCFVLVVLTGAVKTTRWSFENDSKNEPALSFSCEAGRWTVVELSEGGKAFAQTAKSPDQVYNVALVKESRARDLDLSVRLRAIAGNDDQGGGLVWRALDSKNYYIARFNPLEDNFRVYKVVDGKRTQLLSANAKNIPGWHILHVRMRGDHITCELDSKAFLDVHDATFPNAGKIGLWSKADAQTQFDDLILDVIE